MAPLSPRVARDQMAAKLPVFTEEEWLSVQGHQMQVTHIGPQGLIVRARLDTDRKELQTRFQLGQSIQLRGSRFRVEHIGRKDLILALVADDVERLPDAPAPM